VLAEAPPDAGTDPFSGLAAGRGSELRPRLLEAEAAYRELPRPSPALAGSLSALLPGAGQLYIGRPADALVAFLFNGFFVWATVESFRGEHYVTGALLGSVELGWYAGNVYGSYNGALKRNRAMEERFRDQLLHRLGIAATGSPAGPALVAYYRF
jgi:TM2 domain-containing membrane protein YozV